MKNVGTVLCVGELLIDFFCTDIDVNLAKGQHFSKQAGGAPANVSAAVAKLGGKASFLGKVGADPFGMYLKQTLDEQHVDTSMLLFMIELQISSIRRKISLEVSVSIGSFIQAL